MRLSATALFFTGILTIQAQACVGLGANVPTDCIDETGGKNCTCLTIKNACTVPVTASWFVTGTSGKRSTQISPGKSSTMDACTTRRGQSVQYSGFKTFGSSSQAPTLNPVCAALSEERMKIYGRMKVVNARRSGLGASAASASCGTADYHRDYAELLASMLDSRKRDKAAGCGTDNGDIARLSSEVFESRKNAAWWKNSCEGWLKPREKSQQKYAPRPATAPSRDNSDMPVTGGHIRCFGGNCGPDKIPGSDITGLGKKK